MNIKYAFDESQQLYIAVGNSELGNKTLIADADTLSELQEDVNSMIKSLYEDESTEFNKIQESNGSFTKFVLPKPLYEKVNLEVLHGE